MNALPNIFHNNLLISMLIALFKVLSNNSHFIMKLYYQTFKTSLKQIIESAFFRKIKNIFN